MAETDGTPRYRKSKPPKGRNRNTRPNGKAKKRASLNGTLPNGAKLSQEPAEAAQAQDKPEAVVEAPAKPEKNDSDVVKTIPTIIRAPEPVVEAAAEPTVVVDAQVESSSSEPRTNRLQRGPSPTALRAKRPLLASTLRMELTVHRSEDQNSNAEPEISIRPIPSWNDDAADNGTTFMDTQDGVTTQPEGAPRSRKPTAPGGFASVFAGASSGSAEAVDESAVLHETVRRGSDISEDAHPSVNTPRPRRPRRPGERTLIMTRRDTKQSSKRDWVFVVMLVAALGLTASMVLSRQTPTEEAADGATEDEAQQYAEEPGADPFATQLQPYKAKPAPQPAAAPNQQPSAAQPKETESSISASIQATELRSLPSGAEVLAGDAVVGSTPVRVARGSTEMSYTLRMRGHQPKVVSVGPQSPGSIMVELTRIVSGAPSTGSADPAVSHFGPQYGQFGFSNGQPSPEPPADVPAAAPSVNK